MAATEREQQSAGLRAVVTYSLTDHAAARCFEDSFTIEDVVEALGRPHYKQRDPYFGDRWVHYTRIAGEPAKVVTSPAPTAGEATKHAVITVMRLDLTSRT